MDSSTGDGITQAEAAAFFLSPQQPRQRQYEALRAFFVDQIASSQAARRFGYSTRSTWSPKSSQTGQVQGAANCA